MADVMSAPDRDEPPVQDELIVAFWNLARGRAGVRLTEAVIGADWTSMIPPSAWAFGANAGEADRLLAQVLAGTKTATSSALLEYERSGDEVPQVGELSIILDGSGRPGALIRTTGVELVPFGAVDESFALLEGEGSLAEWQGVHRDFFAKSIGVPPAEVADDFQVVAEEFTLLYPRRSDLPATT